MSETLVAFFAGLAASGVSHETIVKAVDGLARMVEHQAFDMVSDALAFYKRNGIGPKEVPFPQIMRTIAINSLQKHQISGLTKQVSFSASRLADEMERQKSDPMYRCVILRR